MDVIDTIAQCPNCADAIMVVDDSFPDHVVYLCPNCRIRYTPGMLRDAQNELIEEMAKEFGQVGRKSRITVIAIFALIGLALPFLLAIL